MTTQEQRKQAFGNLEKFTHAHGLELGGSRRGRPTDTYFMVGFKRTSKCHIVEIKDGGILRGTDTFGMSYPQAYARLIDAISEQLLVLNAMSPDRKEIRVPDLFAECTEPADATPEGITPAVPVFRCNGCDTMEGVKVYTELIQTYCQSCADDLAMPKLIEVEPQPVAPSLKQRFGDWIDARTAQGNRNLRRAVDHR